MFITHCYDINSSKERLKYKGNVFITHINFFIIIARADMSGHSSFMGKYRNEIQKKTTVSFITSGCLFCAKMMIHSFFIQKIIINIMCKNDSVHILEFLMLILSQNMLILHLQLTKDSGGGRM